MLTKEKIMEALQRFEKIPPEMKSLSQWVLWRAENVNGRSTKIPFQVSGVKAKSTDPATWCGFDEAVSAYRDGDYSGVGFVFNANGIVGIDIDHCRDPDTGETTVEWARGIVEYLSSYTEVSPSGTGLHIICRGTLPVAGGNDGVTDGAHIEMYQAGRYFTVSGDVLPGYETITGNPAALLECYDFMRGRKPPKPADDPQPDDRQRPTGSRGNDPFVWAGDIDHLPIKASTKSLILNGAPKGQRSDAIMTVLNALVFSGLDDEQIYGVFSAYPIGEKWRDEKHSREIWLQPQINKARGYVTGRATAGKSEQRDYQHPDGDSQPPKNRFAWVREITCGKPRWVIPGYMEESGFGLLFGDPGSYKSFIAIDWACHVATGTPFYGGAVRQGIVAIIAGEGIVGVPRRIRAWCYRHHIDFDTLPIAVSKCPTAMTDSTDTTDTINNIRALAGDKQVRLIVVDTVARNYGGKDENSTQDMSGFIQACDRIRTEFGAAVLAVHHCGQGDKTRGRGSIALKGALDCEYRISRDSDGDCLVRCTKMKEFAEPPDMSLKPITIDLGETDENGDPVTSLVFERTQKIVEKKQSPATGNGQKQKIMATVLREMIAERDRNLVDSGRDPAGCILLSDWRARLRDFGVTSKNVRDNLQAFTERDGYVFEK